MRKLVLIIVLVCSFNFAKAQYYPEYISDSLDVVHNLNVDSLLVGRSIFDVLSDTDYNSGKVNISQSTSILRAMKEHVSVNSTKKITGYRVRIYFDNSRDARARSEVIANEFAQNYPSIRVYRSHVSPYFKVTVGDFRTRLDAHRFATSISDIYPSVFLVKESINYPNL